MTTAKPDWLRVGTSEGAKAHLRMNDDDRAWCGMDLVNQPAFPAPHHERCRTCMTEFQAFAQQVVAPIPRSVHEAVLVVVRRPAPGRHTAASVINTALARHASWMHETTNVPEQLIVPFRQAVVEAGEGDSHPAE